MRRLVLDLTAAELAQTAVEKGETLDVEAEARRLMLKNPYIDESVDEVVATLREELAAAQDWKIGLKPVADALDLRR